MKYSLKYAVWEITMGCNMRCKHCGSACTTPQIGELTTVEALQLCDQLKELGLEQITLAGGEPLTRKDWHQIAKRLSSSGISVCVISNGWFIDENVVNKALDSGVKFICISIDGMEAVHDFIRKKGSFHRCLSAVELLNKKNLMVTICTTVSAKNYQELSSIYDLLVGSNIDTWQLQLAAPMGNMGTSPDNKVLAPGKIHQLLEFVNRKQNDSNKFPRVIITDCIGYKTELSSKIRTFYKKNNEWGGCQAGKQVIGILHNGDVIGCTSFRNKKYIEGNIREKSLKEIWTDPNAFSWNRNLDSKTLTGFCKKCQYKNHCKGGCSSFKYFTSGTLTENSYCAYMQDIEIFKSVVKQIKNPDIIEKLINDSLESKSYNTAEEGLKAFLVNDPTNTHTKYQLGFVHYQLGQYEECYDINKQLLIDNPDDYYALHGAGLALAKLNRVEEGIKLLEKSIKYAPNKDLMMDCYSDLEKIVQQSK